MRLIVLQDDAMIADVTSTREPVYIGSQSDNAVHLPDARVAAQQALVFTERDAWFIDQLNPGCEMRHNGAVLTERTELKIGDDIRILDYAIRVYPDQDERAAAGRPATPASSLAQLERFAQSKLPPGAVLKRADELLTLHGMHAERLGRVSAQLATCGMVEELITAALKIVLDAFGAQRAWIGVRRVNYGAMEYEEGRLVTGQALDLPELGRTVRPRVLDRAQFVLIPRVSREEPVSVLAGPLLGPGGTLGMVYVDNGDTKQAFEQRDLEFLVPLLTIIAHQLDAIFQQIARNRAAMIAGQVSVAHDIQARLTPRKLPQWDALNFGAFREPGRERTGDIYDVLRLSNDLAALMVAHTPTGGAAPSMLMSQAQAAFKIAGMHQDTPAVFLRSLNWILYDGQGDHALHCFAAAIDPASGTLRYSLAGHLGAFIVDSRGDERRLGTDQLYPPLGAARNTVYPLLPETLEPGETLVVFTPGVTTAKNARDETFGEERFVNILCDAFGQLASSMMKDMLTDLQNFTQGGTQPDDITVILAHRI